MQASSDTIMEISEQESAATEPEVPESDTGDAGEPADSPEPESKVDAAPPAEPPVQDDAELEAGEEKPAEESRTDDPEVAYIEAVDGTKIPETLKIQRKIDGEMREVSIKEALDRYSIAVAGDARFAEANKIKQKSEHQLRNVAQKEHSLKKVASRFVDSMMNGQTRDAVDVLCEFTGQDSEQVWTQVAKAQKETIQRLSALSPEEMALHEAQQSADYYKRRESTKESSKFDDNLVERKFAAQEKYGLEDAELQDATKLLLDFQQKGMYNDENGKQKAITLDDVVSTALDFKLYKSIDETVREALPTKAGDQALYSALFQDTKAYNIAKEDWISIVKEIQKEKGVASKLAKKVASNKSPTLGKQKATKSGSEDDYLDVVDLDELT